MKWQQIYCLEAIDPAIKFFERPTVTNNYPVLRWDSTTELSFECSLDNEAYKPCGRGIFGQWSGYNVPDGQHIFRIKGSDDGKVLAVASYSWNVDRGRLTETNKQEDYLYRL